MTTRREMMIGAAAGVLGLALPPLQADAATAQLDEAMQALTKGAPVNEGRVALTLPGIAENGTSIYTTVTVDSPMTEADHVRAIHILSPKNPIALITSFYLGPRAGRAKLSTNIRLAGSQKVVALAELSDGTFWQGTKDVVVTIAACIDGG
jgi:sulfur-oxidizing protein SoxY